MGYCDNSTKFSKIPSTRLPLFFFRNPLLLENRKFAVRIYMLVARTNPLLVFHYNFGYIKRCGQYYDENKFNREDLFRHVTEQDFWFGCLFCFGILSVSWLTSTAKLEKTAQEFQKKQEGFSETAAAELMSLEELDKCPGLAWKWASGGYFSCVKTAKFFDLWPGLTCHSCFFFFADFWEVGHLARLTFHDFWQQVPARELWYPSLSIELLATGEIHLYGNHLRNQGLDGQQLEYGKGLSGVIPSHHLFIVHDCTRPQKIWVYKPYLCI